MKEESYTIKTEVFEGPLDLLLSLIEKRKLFISDISLAQVADDYIEHVKRLSQFPMDMTASFILIASTLLLIKSKSLLPNLPLTLEEEGSIEDLEERLKIYKRVQEASKHLSLKFGKTIIFQKTQSRVIAPVFSPDEDITTLAMLQSMRTVISMLPKKEVLTKTVVKKIMSLEEMINTLTERVNQNLKMNFGDFAGGHGRTESQGARHTVTREEKVMIIVSFLAMLELVKQGVIEVSQQAFSDDIAMETQTLSVPHYH